MPCAAAPELLDPLPEEEPLPELLELLPELLELPLELLPELPELLEPPLLSSLPPQALSALAANKISAVFFMLFLLRNWGGIYWQAQAAKSNSSLNLPWLPPQTLIRRTKPEPEGRS
ncbi:MAG: hypothetical protein ACHQIO_01220 [Nevskiales bacterium]